LLFGDDYKMVTIDTQSGAWNHEKLGYERQWAVSPGSVDKKVSASGSAVLSVVANLRKGKNLVYPSVYKHFNNHLRIQARKKIEAMSPSKERERAINFFSRGNYLRVIDKY